MCYTLAPRLSTHLQQVHFRLKEIEANRYCHNTAGAYQLVCRVQQQYELRHVELKLFCSNQGKNVTNHVNLHY